jgi:hypothetical protein
MTVSWVVNQAMLIRQFEKRYGSFEYLSEEIISGLLSMIFSVAISRPGSRSCTRWSGCLEMFLSRLITR